MNIIKQYRDEKKIEDLEYRRELENQNYFEEENESEDDFKKFD